MPAAAPALRPLRVLLSSAAELGAVRKIRDRNLSFRYADQGRRPVLRITDFADPKRPSWTEVPIRYDPQTSTYREFSRDFRLAGRKYRLWVDLKSNLHIAPRSGLFGGVDESREVVLGIQEVFQGWISDIEARHQELARGDGRKSLAYFESLGQTAVRVSIFSAKTAPTPDTSNRSGAAPVQFRSTGTSAAQGLQPETGPGDFILDYEPHDVQVLRTRRGGRTAGRLMFDGSSYYRFYFDAGKQELRVEKAP